MRRTDTKTTKSLQRFEYLQKTQITKTKYSSKFTLSCYLINASFIYIIFIFVLFLLLFYA